MKSKLEIILLMVLKSKPNLSPILTLSIGLYYFNNENHIQKTEGGLNVNILFLSNKQVYFFSSKWMSFWSFWILKNIKIFVKVKLYFSNA